MPLNVDFFSAAAASFHPAPYTPTPQPSSSRTAPRPSVSSHDSLAVGMDPQTTDPDILFIHPPFNTFPNSVIYPEGLSYSLMAENPEWFLDANDFISQSNLNPHAISYPPQLEPPRGWCPAKKKDLKDRGVEGWPEGEEPRLRCTFCRRTYAGVNAKSMWRRHVFEKHKIAMSNRRDGNTDRPRGRGSGKENRQQASTKIRDEIHDSLVTMVVVPQTAPEIVSHKSRFRSGKPADASKRRRDRNNKKDTEDEAGTSPTALRPSQKSSSEYSEYESEPEKPSRTRSPPLTPHADTSSDPPYMLPANSDGIIVTSPVILHPVIPESPYNPLQTPSFRHSPPRLPSDQPWRFPSPSHPLHSTNRDISLTMLARPAPSPITRAATTSPSTLLALQPSLSSATPIRSNTANFETPSRSKTLFSRPRNRVHLFHGHISSPISVLRQHTGIKHCPESSPLCKPVTTPKRQKQPLSETWFSEDHLVTASSPSGTILSDPFTIYDSWPPIGDSSRISLAHLPKGPVEPESPVLRSGFSPSMVGLGFGLLEPFGISSKALVDADLKDVLSSPELPETFIDGKRSAASSTMVAESRPSAKRRRLSPASISS